MNNLNKYKLNNSGKTESIIKLELLNNIELINVNAFIKNYKISNFFKGFFFVKRLIKKIFKYKLKVKMTWDIKFWEKIKICIYEVKITYSNSNKNNIKLVDYLKNNFNSKRLKDINNYQEQLNKNINLDFPLLIDSKSLSMLGANVSENQLFILDGSRRIIANLLNNKKKVKIYIIIKKCINE